MRKIRQVLPESDYEIINLQGRKYFLCQLTSAETGWTYVNMFPYSSIYFMNTMVRYCLIGGFLCVVCGGDADSEAAFHGHYQTA